MELLSDMGHVEARFGSFGDSVSLDVRYMHGLCFKRTIGSKIILGPPDRLLGDVGQGECCFCPFGDSVSVVAR